MQKAGVAITEPFGSQAEKSPGRQDVYRMFDRIASRYDLVNRLLSFGQDIRWRKKLAKLLPERQSQSILDLATGTGDVLLSLVKYSKNIKYGIGLDMSAKMLAEARRKLPHSVLSENLSLLRGDATSIPCCDSSFDVVTIAFGIRNVTDVKKSLSEMHRVLNNSGKVLILEFSLPPNILIRKLHLFYLRYLLPAIGGLISGDKEAYQYLNRTIETFPYGSEFLKLMDEAGFKSTKAHPLTFGVATIYEGEK
ncbi:MAG: bifunctional demethylmenaquinone methyltransferase/2-methoxy-6-polyprenyl-1,4-benzoquinol methylase UbiE [candidate division Zixibacteria bacterium]|nr:bifunctional demethylmenaquinone methyltransferase/2-methoxy-6-polyprenyl-1,4-benzoquinol methylase UbiE [candidate division Zixibacteria bacterium]